MHYWLIMNFIEESFYVIDSYTLLLQGTVVLRFTMITPYWTDNWYFLISKVCCYQDMNVTFSIVIFRFSHFLLLFSRKGATYNSISKFLHTNNTSSWRPCCAESVLNVSFLSVSIAQRYTLFQFKSLSFSS